MTAPRPIVRKFPLTAKPTEPGLIGHFVSNGINSVSDYIPTRASVTAFNTTHGFIPGTDIPAMKFVGNQTSYVLANNTDKLQLVKTVGTSFTVEAWVYPTAVEVDPGWQKRTGDGTASQQIYLKAPYAVWFPVAQKNLPYTFYLYFDRIGDYQILGGMDDGGTISINGDSFPFLFLAPQPVVTYNIPTIGYYQVTIACRNNQDSKFGFGFVIKYPDGTNFWQTLTPDGKSLPLTGSKTGVYNLNAGGEFGGMIVNKDQEFEFSRMGDGRVAVAVDWGVGTDKSLPSTGWIIPPTNTAVIPLNTATHVAIVVDNTTLRIVLNGILAWEKTGLDRKARKDATDFYIGNRTSKVQPFAGYIGDVRIWDYARSVDEINANKNTVYFKINTVETPLQLYPSTNNSYSAFGNQYGVWNTSALTGAAMTVIRKFNAPIAGTYRIRAIADDLNNAVNGSLYIDDNKITGTLQNFNAVPTPISVTLTAGEHILKFEISNAVGGQGMLACTISDSADTQIFWDTRTYAVVNFNTTVSRHTLTMPFSGSMTMHLWGGGGAGGTGDINGVGGKGSPGLYNTHTVSFAKGDIVEVAVGEGGKSGTSGRPIKGGAGGRSRININNQNIRSFNGGTGGNGPVSGSGGGGGGATAVLVNGQLVAAAGGGGAGGGAGNGSNGKLASIGYNAMGINGEIQVQSSHLSATTDKAQSWIKVNGANVVFGVTRGHTLAVFNPVTLEIESKQTFDTYGSKNSLALTNALTAVADRKIIAIVSYDGTTLDLATRNLLNTQFGAPNADQAVTAYPTKNYSIWGANKVSHAFIGVKNGNVTGVEGWSSEVKDGIFSVTFNTETTSTSGDWTSVNPFWQARPSGVSQQSEFLKPPYNCWFPAGYPNGGKILYEFYLNFDRTGTYSFSGCVNDFGALLVDGTQVVYCNNTGITHNGTYKISTAGYHKVGVRYDANTAGTDAANTFGYLIRYPDGTPFWQTLSPGYAPAPTLAIGQPLLDITNSSTYTTIGYVNVGEASGFSHVTTMAPPPDSTSSTVGVFGLAGVGYPRGNHLRSLTSNTPVQLASFDKIQYYINMGTEKDWGQIPDGNEDNFQLQYSLSLTTPKWVNLDVVSPNLVTPNKWSLRSVTVPSAAKVPGGVYLRFYQLSQGGAWTSPEVGRDTWAFTSAYNTQTITGVRTLVFQPALSGDWRGQNGQSKTGDGGTGGGGGGGYPGGIGGLTNSGDSGANCGQTGGNYPVLTAKTGTDSEYYISGVATGGGGTSGNQTLTGINGGPGYAVLIINPEVGYAPISGIKVAGTWRQVTAAYVKVAGEWKIIESSYVKKDGKWRQIRSTGDRTLTEFTGETTEYGSVVKTHS
jgi:hypothetical protein